MTTVKNLTNELKSLLNDNRINEIKNIYASNSTYLTLIPNRYSLTSEDKNFLFYLKCSFLIQNIANLSMFPIYISIKTRAIINVSLISKNMGFNTLRDLLICIEKLII